MKRRCFIKIHLSVFYQSVHRCIITGKAKTSIVIAGMPKLKIAIKSVGRITGQCPCLLWQLTDWHWGTHEPTTGKNMRNYLIKAAISDQVCPLKENLALQELALYIFKEQGWEVSRANRYLNYSLEDAMYYNNRLRMPRNSKKIPFHCSFISETEPY